eukprot:Sspe_Gene.11427::Locus_3861_Transcript_1_1_Confidence_1.000_Length_1712::g.11427::m.11427/K08857/NEK1_4_5; NIMA (never in mitosis gene a)-related kinase 1/4/5
MNAFDDLHPPWDNYKCIKNIGAGSFGQVYLVSGIPEHGGKEGLNVIKRVYVLDLSEKNQRSAINEVQLLLLLDHPNVITYRDHFLDRAGFLNIVLEYCSEGDLSHSIDYRRENGQFFTQDEVIFLAFQLLQGMKYIHSIEIIHRDLKPANIFLTRDKVLKIADFGISKHVESGGVGMTFVGTVSYMAPELAESTRYTYAVDVWSAGCVLYELAALEKAFDASNKNMIAVLNKVTTGKYKPLPKKYKKVSQMISQMIVLDPNARSTVEDLVKEFFTGLGSGLPPVTDIETPMRGGGVDDLERDESFAEWGSKLYSGWCHQSEQIPSPPERVKSKSGSERKKASNGHNSSGGSSGKKRRKKVKQAAMPELEFVLLPSQKCLLLDEKDKENVVFRERDQPIKPPRPEERSGRRPEDSFTSTLSAPPSIAKEGQPSDDEDDNPYRDDEFEEEDNCGNNNNNNTYSDDSFEDDEEGLEHVPLELQLSEAEKENIRKAIEIDSETALKAQIARQHRNKQQLDSDS